MLDVVQFQVVMSSRMKPGGGTTAEKWSEVHCYWWGQGTKKLVCWVNHLCGHWSYSRFGVAERQEPESKAFTAWKIEGRTTAHSDEGVL